MEKRKENCLTSGVELLPPVLHRREGSSASISVDSLTSKQVNYLGKATGILPHILNKDHG